MQNEYYYRSELENLMAKFFEEEEEHDFGWLFDNIEKLMADAAFNVLATVRSTNDFFQRENLLNPINA